jgi:hypothetical protein
VITPGAVFSERQSRQIERFWAVVCVDVNGMEGVVRRDTPSGTQPLMSDDEDLALTLLTHAREDLGFRDAVLVTFVRQWTPVAGWPTTP